MGFSKKILLSIVSLSSFSLLMSVTLERRVYFEGANIICEQQELKKGKEKWVEVWRFEGIKKNISKVCLGGNKGEMVYGRTPEFTVTTDSGPRTSIAVYYRSSIKQGPIPDWLALEEDGKETITAFATATNKPVIWAFIKTPENKVEVIYRTDISFKSPAGTGWKNATEGIPAGESPLKIAVGQEGHTAVLTSRELPKPSDAPKDFPTSYDFSLFVRTGITAENPYGTEWKRINIEAPGIPSIQKPWFLAISPKGDVALVDPQSLNLAIGSGMPDEPLWKHPSVPWFMHKDKKYDCENIKDISFNSQGQLLIFGTYGGVSEKIKAGPGKFWYPDTESHGWSGKRLDAATTSYSIVTYQ